MATISGATNEKVYGVTKWLGLNEHPDGDTRLKLGEASKMVNWKITRDGNLKRRPGSEFIVGLCESYTLTNDMNIVKLADGLLGSNAIVTYPSASAMQTPGKVTLYGGSGAIEGGVLTGSDVTVINGVLQAGSTTTISVSGGVVEIVGGGDTTTVAQLYEELLSHDDSDPLYIYFQDGAYAIWNGCLVPSGSTYTLAGYRVTATPDTLTEQDIKGMWVGYANSELNFLCACDGSVWRIYRSSTGFTREFVDYINTDKGVSFIPFDGKVYILNGYDYYVYDGENITVVDGYVPLVAMAIGPQGSGEAGELTSEYVNRLNGKRRIWISPDGAGTAFNLPEKAKAIDRITNLSDGTEITAYSFTPGTDLVTFTAPPAKAVSSIEIAYSVNTHEDDASIPDYRSQVTANLFGELYSGTVDTRIFLYGDGTNKTIYSGMDYDGMPRADYFPDQYEVLVGDSNTPITAMVRHYGALIAYKTSECWALQHGVVELATGDLTPSIYCTPVNREKGNVAPGQIALVNNSPVTCSGTELYQWTNSSYYTSNLTRDERQARRISDRVQKSIKEIDFTECCLWDDDDGQEFYISDGGVTLVWNYAADAWYRYEGLDIVKMVNFQGEVFYGTSGGKVMRLTYDVDGDEEYPVKAEWESGAIDFGAGNMRKYSSMLWVGLKPVAGTSVDVCVETDRKNTFHEKVVSSEKAKINGQPFMTRTKIKAKKFVYYRLLLNVSDKMPAVTVTDVEFRVRQTGYSK